MQADLSQRTHLQNFLEDSIPAVKELRFQLDQVNDCEVVAKAPLIENSNHMGTAFGGSLYSLLVLTSYSWLYSRVTKQGLPCRIVIQTGHIDYIQPVDRTIETRCQAPDENEWNRFLSVFEKKGRARLQLTSRVICDDDVAATLLGTFVVFKKGEENGN